MTSPAQAAASVSPPTDHAPPLKPAGVREFTPRAIIVAVVVAAVIGGSYPYVVLKLGFGPNISVVSAFFGYLALGIAFRNFNRWENNIVQTAGTSAGQTAFLCTLMAAFDLLRRTRPRSSRSCSSRIRRSSGSRAPACSACCCRCRCAGTSSSTRSSRSPTAWPRPRR